MVRKINFIARIDPFKGDGGGEVVLRSLLNHGLDNDYIESINICTPETTNYYDPDADFTIIADIYNFPRSPIRFTESFLNMAMNANHPYFVFQNGYADICGLDYFPCSGYEEDMEKCSHRHQDCLFEKLTVQRLFAGAKTSYFVSPQHEEVMKCFVDPKRSFVVRPIINTQMFFNANLPREIPYLYVGTICEAKGVFNILKWAEENKIDPVDIAFVGTNISGVDLKLMGFQYSPKLPYEDLPNVYNRTDTFIHFPRWPEPQGRTVVEAALCGCNLLVNDNVGATSFSFDLSKPENIDGAEQEFWDDINQQTGYQHDS